MARQKSNVAYSFSNPYEVQSQEQFRLNFNRALTGTVVGGAVGLASTVVAEPTIKFAEGVSATAGLRTYKGLKVQSGDCAAYLPELQIDTHLPILKGVHLATKDKKLLCRDPKKIIDDPRLQALSTAASQRKQGITEPVKDSLVARAEHGAAVGAASFVLLPVLGAIAIKRLASSRFTEKTKDSLHWLKKNRKAQAALGISAVGALYGCGTTINDQTVAEPLVGTKIPGQLRIYQPEAVHNAVIKGEFLKDGLNYVLREVNRGERTWNRARINLISQIAEHKTGYEYLYDANKKYYKTLIETGVLCNTGFTKSVAPLLQADTRPNLTIDTGDRQIAGGRNAFIERHCEPNLTTNYHAKYILATGNHDQTKDYKVQVSKIDGQTYVTSADPRSRLGKEDRSGVKGEALKRALALQGSKLASRVCKIYYKTGIKPNLVSHTLDAAVETLKKGCAANVYTDHPVFIDIDLSKGSVLKKYYSQDKTTSTDVLISTSSAGAINRNTPFKEPEKPGDVVVKYSLAPNSRFVKALIFSWNQDGSTIVTEKNPPKPEKLPAGFNGQIG